MANGTQYEVSHNTLSSQIISLYNFLSLASILPDRDYQAYKWETTVRYIITDSFKLKVSFPIHYEPPQVSCKMPYKITSPTCNFCKAATHFDSTI